MDRFRFRVENERLGKSLAISNAGDTKLALGQIVTRAELHAANAEAEAVGGEPAKGRKPKPRLVSRC